MGSIVYIMTPTFPGLILNGLFQGCDVLEGTEEQHHLVLLVLDGGHVQQEPEWSSWGVLKNINLINIQVY